ncbi:ABC transporter ATP-binding protein [Faecalicatena sp. Marseille-Q4148]|nr:ABC transporter ATP-binding protein [Faecalicatena sp. Marseille-Q4148]
MEELMLKINNVSKIYKLGQIGGTTFRDELQRFGAKLLKKDDPTKKIGSKEYNKGDTFMALNGVSFEVKKGERVGIIGHNGAGKSTLLKLISRVTAPSSGEICMNGRIASMLEVGTGFHPELTGRENVYMNGAILGMTKAEIDKKMEDIIEFSECRKFIDTPVKRYSSGMYVKLAFSVAAHLDSEILIMDEVLAVGDMAFQTKCLDKMSDVSKKDGRTILYVSHNMNTIRQLCDRCVVLDHGKVIFDGEVEEAIAIYSHVGDLEKFSEKSLIDTERYCEVQNDRIASFMKVNLLGETGNEYRYGDNMKLKLTISAKKEIQSASVRFTFWSKRGYSVASSFCVDFDCIPEGESSYMFDVPISQLVSNIYDVGLVLLEKSEFGSSSEIDVILAAFTIRILENYDFYWNPNEWGHVRMQDTLYEGEY